MLADPLAERLAPLVRSFGIEVRPAMKWPSLPIPT